MMIISFDEYKKKELEAEEYRNSILKLIDEFIKFDEEFIDAHFSKEQISRYRHSTDFFTDRQRRGDFVVKYMYDKFSFDDVHFTHPEYLRLQEFMKDPELYKSLKKYNI